MNVVVQMALVKTGYVRAKELKPSARFAPTHKEFLEAMRLYDKAMDTFADGVDNQDAGRIEEAAELMQKGAERLAAATAELEELK